MEAHLLDFVLCIPLLWGIIRGFMRGLVFEIAILLAVALGFWGGFALAGIASAYLTKTFNITGNWLHYTSFLVVFLLIVLLIILLGKLLTSAIALTGLGIFNRIAGGIFGLMKWILILAAALWLINPINESAHLISKEKRESSYMLEHLLWLGKTMVPVTRLPIPK